MTLKIPLRKPSAHVRRPSFVSPGLQSIALYDGTLLVYAADIDLAAQSQFTTAYGPSGAATTVTPGSCTNDNTTETCTLTLTTIPGAHIYGLVGYTSQESGTPPPCNTDTCSPVNFGGVISSEGEFSVNLVPGTNPGATLTMRGVAYSGYIRSDAETELAYNTPTPFGYQIVDSAFYQILTPGDYDNGPITWTVSPRGILTIDHSADSTPPSSPGDQTLTVTCTSATGGTATIMAFAKTKPNTAYASSLTYSTSNYGGGTLMSMLVSCDPQ